MVALVRECHDKNIGSLNTRRITREEDDANITLQLLMITCTSVA